MNVHDRQLVLTACSLLALQAEQQRRGTAGPRAARACVARLVLAAIWTRLVHWRWSWGCRRCTLGSGWRLCRGLPAPPPKKSWTRSRRRCPAGSNNWSPRGRGGNLGDPPAGGLGQRPCRHRTRPRPPRAGRRLLVSDELDVAEISVHRPGMRRGLQEMAPGEERDLARPQTPGSVGRSLEPLLNYTRADLLGASSPTCAIGGSGKPQPTELGVHRNTLRHRIGTSMRVMDVNLDDPDVASTIWSCCGPAASHNPGAATAAFVI
jgi:purine catabolism regulator